MTTQLSEKQKAELDEFITSNQTENKIQKVYTLLIAAVLIFGAILSFIAANSICSSDHLGRHEIRSLAILTGIMILGAIGGPFTIVIYLKGRKKEKELAEAMDRDLGRRFE